MTQLLKRALANRYTRASFRTLSKRADSGESIDTDRALRLLRRNVRDVAPSATHAVQQSVALQLLQTWLDSRINDSSATNESE